MEYVRDEAHASAWRGNFQTYGGGELRLGDLLKRWKVARPVHRAATKVVKAKRWRVGTNEGFLDHRFQIVNKSDALLRLQRASEHFHRGGSVEVEVDEWRLTSATALFQSAAVRFGLRALGLAAAASSEPILLRVVCVGGGDERGKALLPGLRRILRREAALGAWSIKGMSPGMAIDKRQATGKFKLERITGY
ncbi:hypothetical protein HYQ46_000167 [Verticillium longisporum]|nr:hypothetical protein HYQ46_000167 [Verticillium longisporum]